MLRVETGVVCFSHLQSTLFGVEYTRDREPVRTGGWAQEALCLAVIHIFTAIRTQPSHRKTRSERSGNDTNAVMTFKRPPLSRGRTFLKTTATQLEHAEAHTCLRHDKANLVIGCLQILVSTKTWHALHHTSYFHLLSHFFLHPVFTFLPDPQIQSTTIYFAVVGDHKQAKPLTWLILWCCECGFVPSKNRKTAMDVLELICLRDGLECEVLNTAALQNCLHLMLLLLHIISLTTFISGYLRPSVQHLYQTWFQIMWRSLRICSFQICFLPILSYTPEISV